MWNSHKMKNCIKCTQKIKVANKFRKYSIREVQFNFGDKNKIWTFQNTCFTESNNMVVEKNLTVTINL